MKNLLIVTPINVTTKMLQELVFELGGDWDDSPTLNQGVITDSKGTIYISLVSDVCTEYEDDELKAIEKILLQAPKKAIDIHIGHDEGSFVLAKKFSNEIVERWEGFIDDTKNPESKS